MIISVRVKKFLEEREHYGDYIIYMPRMMEVLQMFLEDNAPYIDPDGCGYVECGWRKENKDDNP